MTGPDAFSGPGLWIRIQHRFHTRMTEWLLAIITGLWGGILLLPGETFAQPAFAGFDAIFRNEVLLGLAMLALGVLRLIGLIINGARQNVTPHIRVASAGCGCLIFVGICYCYMLSGIVSTWLAIYPAFAVCELTNVFRAAHDVGESKNGKAT